MAEDRTRDISARLRVVWQRHNVSRAILFGSLARGEATRHSDLDLLVIQETEARFLDRYDGFLAEVVQQAPGYDVDLLIYTPEELAQMADRPFVARILAEGIVIYEREQEQA